MFFCCFFLFFFCFCEICHEPPERFLWFFFCFFYVNVNTKVSSDFLSQPICENFHLSCIRSENVVEGFVNGAELQQILRDLQRKIMTEIFVTLQDELFELLTLW